MRKLVKLLRNAVFFLLCFAPIPLVVGDQLVNNPALALAVLAMVLPLAFLLSLVPGRIGGGKREEVAVVQKSFTSDPDPDRALRNEALPAAPRRAFPLRAMCSLLTALALAAIVFFLPPIQEEGWISRLVLAAVYAALLPVSVKVALERASSSTSVFAGIVMYLLGGVVAFFAGDADLNRWLLLCGMAFLLLAALGLNDQSVEGGATVRAGVRPPARLRRRNRLMVGGIVAVGATVLCFDRIRQAAIVAGQQTVIWIMKIMVWLSNLYPGGGTSLNEGGGDGGGMAGMFGEAESSPFWKFMEKIAIGLAVLILIGLILFALWKIGKKLVSLARRIAAWFKRYASAVSEDYQDEQESLFDWGETRRELGEGLRKRIRRLTAREKKWEQMDVRERVRYVVRCLYRRAPERDSFASLTVREAAGRMNTGQAAPQEVADLYERARYGREDIAPEAAERLRKEAKV